jgi:hypothetical protein
MKKAEEKRCHRRWLILQSIPTGRQHRSFIFLTPRVIYDTTQMADATQELKDKMRDLRKMIKE